MYSVAAADVDADDSVDIVTANSDRNTVSVLLGHGDGSFAAEADFSTGAGPRAVAVGDLDGDGAPDIAAANERDDAVSLLLGRGDGTFSAKDDLPTDRTPESVAIADLDADGLLDLVAANAAESNVTIRLQEGFAITPRVVGDALGHGAIAPSATTTVRGGSTPTFTFTPESGYSVRAVTVDGARVGMTGDNSYTFPAVVADHTITVEFVRRTISVSLPGATSRWPSGSTQAVTWVISPTVYEGEFRVSLINQTSGAWYVNKQVPVVEGHAGYATQVIVAVPAGSYKAAVYWRPTVGSGLWLASTKSAAFAVTPINISAPIWSTVWPTDAGMRVWWNVNPAMSEGEFRVWLIDQASGIWYVNKQVLAVAGKTSYSAAVNTLVPPGSYKAAVYWRATVGSGAWTAAEKSAVFTIATLAVTSPTAASSWPRFSTQIVAWSVTPGLPAASSASRSSTRRAAPGT